MDIKLQLLKKFKGDLLKVVEKVKKSKCGVKSGLVTESFMEITVGNALIFSSLFLVILKLIEQKEQ